MKKSVLIIGGDSGLGKSISSKLIKQNMDVISTTRKKNVKNKISLDFKNVVSNFPKLKRNLKDKKFDYVLFTAAITTNNKEVKNKNCTFGNLQLNDFVKLMEVNCFSNLKIFEFLNKLKFLKKNSVIIFFSSLAGSITNRGKLKHNKPFGNLFYRLSKASLNCGVKNLSYDFKKEYTIISLHPGYVKTISGGKNADFTVSYATDKILSTIKKIKKSDSGNFIDLNGKKIKW